MNRGSRKGGATPKHTAPAKPTTTPQKQRKAQKPTRQRKVSNSASAPVNSHAVGIATKAVQISPTFSLTPPQSVSFTTSPSQAPLTSSRKLKSSPVTEQHATISTLAQTRKPLKQAQAPTASIDQSNPLTQQYRFASTAPGLLRGFTPETQQSMIGFALQCATFKQKRTMTTKTTKPTKKTLKSSSSLSTTAPHHTSPIQITAKHSHSLLFTPRARFSTVAPTDKKPDVSAATPAAPDASATPPSAPIGNSPEVILTEIKSTNFDGDSTEAFSAPRAHKMVIKVNKSVEDSGNDADNGADAKKGGKKTQGDETSSDANQSSTALTPVDNQVSTKNIQGVGSTLSMKGSCGEPEMTKFEKFLERNPGTALLYRFFRKISKIALYGSLFLGTVAFLSTQASSYIVLVQPAKDLLHSESTAVLAGALEEMAALGLIDMKLIPTSVVEAMADPANRQFGKDPNLKIEKPELGYFIGSSEAFKGRTLPTSDALPRYHDAFLIEADANETYVMREAVRNQHVALTKGLFEVENQATNNMKVNLQLLPGILSAYSQLYVQYPEFVHLVAQFKQTPLYAIERVIDVMYLRSNNTPDLLRTLTKDMSHDSLNHLVHSKQPEAYDFGAKIQHYLMNDATETGRMLKKIDDRFISSFRMPSEIDQQLLADHPFREELSNIPAEILQHPDRSLTGPLFQTYYNILGRNQYFNLLVEENKMLSDLRMQLVPVAESFGLIHPSRPITGMNDADLNDELLKPYLEFNQKQIQTRMNKSSIDSSHPNPMTLNQTPLFNQPFHFFKSTGVAVGEANFQVQRKFEDIMPVSDRVINQAKLTAQVRDASALERYLVEPVNLTKDSEMHIDTTSLTRRHREDVVNQEWAQFDALPSRWVPDMRAGVNPFIPSDEVSAMQRLLTKLDVTVLRNQAEMVRIHKVAMEQNPIFGQHHQKLLDLEDEKNAKINELFENMAKAEEDARKAAEESEGVEEKKWYQFW